MKNAINLAGISNVSSGVGTGANNIVVTITNAGSSAVSLGVSDSSGNMVSSGTSIPGTSNSVTFTIYAPTQSNPYTLTAQTSGSNYRSCTAPCFYAIPLSGSPNDSVSSPYYTYNSSVSDTMFIGDDSGKMHKVTGVFKGSPAEVTTNWPATVSTQTSNMLSSPIYDSGSSGLIFVGDSSGYLYSIQAGTTPGTALRSNQLECGTGGIADAPIVDSVTGYVYVFMGDGCSGTPSDSYINRFPTGTSISGSYGTAMAFGNAATNDSGTIQYDGAFDNTYYNGAGNTGNLYACVNGTVYQIPMSSTFGSTINTYATEATATSDTATCSPLTEYYNPSGAGVDYLFLSLWGNGKTVSGTTCTNGCIYNFLLPSSSSVHTGSANKALQATGGTSSIIIDNDGTGTGQAQVYYSSLSNQACAGNGTTGSGTGTCAVQASQSGLQ